MKFIIHIFFLLLIIALASSPILSQSSAFRVKLQIYCTDTDIGGRIESYLSRELRDLRDVQIATLRPDFRIYIHAMKLDLPSTANDPLYAYTLVAFEPIHEEWAEEAKAALNPMQDQFMAQLLNLVFTNQERPVYDCMFYGPKSRLQELATEAALLIDGGLFSKRREGKTDLAYILKKFKARLGNIPSGQVDSKLANYTEELISKATFTNEQMQALLSLTR